MRKEQAERKLTTKRRMRVEEEMKTRIRKTKRIKGEDKGEEEALLYICMMLQRKPVAAKATSVVKQERAPRR